MHIHIEKLPHVSTSTGFFSLCYGVANPIMFSLTDLLELDAESEIKLREAHPEMWLHQLSYRLPDGRRGLLPFSPAYATREQLEEAMRRGIEIADPEHPVVKAALDAFVAAEVARISRTSEG
jgi:hypothetical protein